MAPFRFDSFRLWFVIGCFFLSNENKKRFAVFFCVVSFLRRLLFFVRLIRFFFAFKKWPPFSFWSFSAMLPLFIYTDLYIDEYRCVWVWMMARGCCCCCWCCCCCCCFFSFVRACACFSSLLILLRFFSVEWGKWLNFPAARTLHLPEEPNTHTHKTR